MFDVFSLLADLDDPVDEFFVAIWLVDCMVDDVPEFP
jgi:hypothetical protein